MYNSHLNLIFSSVCYMLLVTSKYGLTAATVLQEQFDTCNEHLNLQFLRLMICTDHTQIQELHLKNQLHRSYNKLTREKKSYKKINKAFLFNKVFKRLAHSKVFVQFISISINNNIGEYNTNTFIYISCTIVFRYTILCIYRF